MKRQQITDSEAPTLKKDSLGRIYREIRCDQCRAWLADEYIREGRIILKCFRCGNISLMVFHSRRKRSNQERKEKPEEKS